MTKWKETEIGKIPEDWEVKTFGDICLIRRGASPRPIHNFISTSGIPWVKIADATAQNSPYIEWTNEFIIEKGRDNTVSVKPGDLIVSNSATPGIPKFMKINAAIHDGWLLIEPSKKIDKWFLYYLFIFLRPRLVGMSSGTVFRNLKTDIVRNYKIAMPTLSEQRAIAEILSSIDFKIELNNQMNATLEAMAQAIFKQWFIDFEFPDENGKPYKSSGGKMVDSELGKIPEGWLVKNIQDILVFEKGTEPGSKYYLKENSNESVRFIRVRDLDNTEHNRIFIPLSLAKGKFCYDKDVLLSLDATIGRVQIGMKGTFSSGIRKVYSKDKMVPLKGYVYSLLKSEHVQSTMKIYSNGTTILHAGVSLDYINLAIPNINILKKFSEIANVLFDKIVANILEINNLENIRDSMLPKLMSGQIRVPLEVIKNA